MKYGVFYSFLRNGVVLLSILTYKIVLKSHLKHNLNEKGYYRHFGKTILLII